MPESYRSQEKGSLFPGCTHFISGQWSASSYAFTCECTPAIATAERARSGGKLGSEKWRFGELEGICLMVSGVTTTTNEPLRGNLNAKFPVASRTRALCQPCCGRALGSPQPYLTARQIGRASVAHSGPGDEGEPWWLTLAEPESSARLPAPRLVPSLAGHRERSRHIASAKGNSGSAVALGNAEAG